MEIELKLEMDPACRVSLEAFPILAETPPRAQSLISDYFDTPDQDLRRAGFALRIRRVGRQRIQTVKAETAPAAGLFVRSEWEHPVSGGKPVFTAESGPLANVFAKEQLDRIERLFTTRVKRFVRDVSFGEASIELAIDAGTIEWQDSKLPLHEVELELKAGPSAAIFDLAKLMVRDLPLRLGVQSKAERGFALIKAPPGKSRRAEIMLAPGETAADACAAIAQACIRHYRLNETLVLASGDTGALHQARVALRQLRTAFWLFAPLFGSDAESERLRVALKDLADRYGAVRNIDVLIPRIKGEARTKLTEARRDALSRLQAELHEPFVRLIMIELAEWIMMGSWRTAGSGATAGASSAFATHALERVRKRLKRKGKALATLDPATRHQARIEAKRLRYATEFFASLYAGKKAQRRLKSFRLALAELQDVLGELNDREMAPALLAALGIDASLSVSKGDRQEKLLRKAEDAYDALFDTKPFWRA
jgi:triphosphatase